ncbi:hypothetical protein B0H10DRAFT_2216070 [Mycena sp. CBHHK59/15]|nr:hypothetical protein B0H10DRAFT_2216070 [Mycena sp. CBHHK59/15]
MSSVTEDEGQKDEDEGPLQDFDVPKPTQGSGVFLSVVIKLSGRKNANIPPQEVIVDNVPVTAWETQHFHIFDKKNAGFLIPFNYEAPLHIIENVLEWESYCNNSFTKDMVIISTGLKTSATNSNNTLFANVIKVGGDLGRWVTVEESGLPDDKKTRLKEITQEEEEGQGEGEDIQEGEGEKEKASKKGKEKEKEITSDTVDDTAESSSEGEDRDR